MKQDDYFWVTFEASSIFWVSCGVVAKTGSSFKSNHKNQVKDILCTWSPIFQRELRGKLKFEKNEKTPFPLNPRPSNLSGMHLRDKRVSSNFEFLATHIFQSSSLSIKYIRFLLSFFKFSIDTIKTFNGKTKCSVRLWGKIKNCVTSFRDDSQSNGLHMVLQVYDQNSVFLGLFLDGSE